MIDLMGGRKRPPEGYKTRKEEHNVLGEKLTEIPDIPSDMHLTIFGKGAFLGEEDVIYRKEYTGTLKCIT